MNPNQTSTMSKSRAERPTRRAFGTSLRALVQNLIVRARLWILRLVSFAYARVAMIFIAGFIVGAVWDAYNGAARKAIAGWSPHLSWMAPTAASERLKAMDLALATARQSLNKLASEMSRLEAQGVDGQRRSAR